ncbi:MAG: hypothetical protein U0527_05845 [Candidatus Eisenbacteria bacterium]
MKSLTPEQAYAAMQHFIEHYYSFRKEISDDVSDLLSDMQLLGDHRPADSGLWPAWERAIDKAKRDGGIYIQLTK